MSKIAVLHVGTNPANTQFLSALKLLPHDFHFLTNFHEAYSEAFDIIVVNACQDLLKAHQACKILDEKTSATLCVIINDAGLAALSPQWPISQFILDTANIAEIEARLRLCTPAPKTLITSSALTIDEDSYTAKIEGRTLDLTFREFELLKYLAQAPGQAFSRNQLLNDVWGYDYFGGTRTVDVHIRRLRAKLGHDFEHMISTVRNVGYIFKDDQEKR